VATPYPETGCPVITVEKQDADRAPGEWAPAVPARVATLLLHCGNPYALHLYVKVQALPDGFEIGDESLMRLLGWTRTRLRRAKEALHRAGLYVWKSIRTAGGHFMTICRYLTNPAGSASPQVAPAAPRLAARQGARIPLSTEKTERAPHDPDRCARDAAGLPCRACGEARKATVQPVRVPRPPALRPIADVLAQEFGDGRPPAVPIPTPAPVPAGYGSWRDVALNYLRRR
jgi:hypothetical protein